jgi:hypothetical protein
MHDHMPFIRDGKTVCARDGRPWPCTAAILAPPSLHCKPVPTTRIRATKPGLPQRRPETAAG